MRIAGWNVIRSIWECLTLVNQVFFDRGLCHALEEVQKLEQRPPNMEHLINTISTSSDPHEVLLACERGDHVAAGTGVWSLQDVVIMMLSQTREGAEQGTTICTVSLRRRTVNLDSPIL